MAPATHTLLIGLNSICQFQCEPLSPDLGCLVLRSGGPILLEGAGAHACMYTHANASIECTENVT